MVFFNFLKILTVERRAIAHLGDINDIIPKTELFFNLSVVRHTVWLGKTSNFNPKITAKFGSYFWTKYCWRRNKPFWFSLLFYTKLY